MKQKPTNNEKYGDLKVSLNSVKWFRRYFATSQSHRHKYNHYYSHYSSSIKYLLCCSTYKNKKQKTSELVAQLVLLIFTYSFMPVVTCFFSGKGNSHVLKQKLLSLKILLRPSPQCFNSVSIFYMKLLLC